MSVYIAIAVGGSFGAVSRYWVFTTMHRWLGQDYPYAVLSVNILGSVVMGFLSVLLVHRFQVSEEIRLGILLGFLGSFTTFSAFAMDTLNILNTGALVKAMSYVLLSVLFCILGAWAGLVTAKHII